VQTTIPSRQMRMEIPSLTVDLSTGRANQWKAACTLDTA
jgi:hypothetical protein